MSGKVAYVPFAHARTAMVSLLLSYAGELSRLLDENLERYGDHFGRAAAAMRAKDRRMLVFRANQIADELMNLKPACVASSCDDVAREFDNDMALMIRGGWLLGSLGEAIGAERRAYDE